MLGEDTPESHIHSGISLSEPTWLGQSVTELRGLSCQEHFPGQAPTPPLGPDPGGATHH